MKLISGDVAQNTKLIRGDVAQNAKLEIRALRRLLGRIDLDAKGFASLSAVFARDTFFRFIKCINDLAFLRVSVRVSVRVNVRVIVRVSVRVSSTGSNRLVRQNIGEKGGLEAEGNSGG